MIKMIPLAKPIFTDEMKEAAIHALQNEWFVLGESVNKFEEEFAKYCGTKYAISVNSGTAALYLSLIALGIKNNEKVVTSPNSFIASANSIIYAGGKPEFADIETDTGNIDPNKINPDGIRGIMPVHIYGQPCDMERIMEIAEENNLIVVEDACQAHGAEYKGKKVGSIGDVGCFSFYSSKNMTVCGDGGMIIADNEEVAKKVKSLRDCGRKSKYEHSMLGFTCRLNTVNAAIGRVQLKHLDEWNLKRHKAAEIYRQLIPKELLLSGKGDTVSVFHMFVIKTENRDKLIEFLNSNGIGTGIHYLIPIHLQPIYKELFGYKKNDFPDAERFSEQVLSLPMFPEINKDEIKFICEKIIEVL